MVLAEAGRHSVKLIIPIVNQVCRRSCFRFSALAIRSLTLSSVSPTGHWRGFQLGRIDGRLDSHAERTRQQR